MRHPWVNTALLLLLVLQLVTGFLGLIAGDPGQRWRLWLHDTGGWAILVLLAWKAMVIGDSLARRRRPPPQRPLFLVMTALLVATLGTGFIWTTAGRVELAGYGLVTIHTTLAVALALLLASHTLSMRFIFGVRGAADRRAFLRLAATGVAGAAIWQTSGALKGFLDLPGSRRRFTGSYETGSYTCQFPRVSWFGDDPDPVDRDSWRLIVDGAVDRPFTLTYQELGEMGEDHSEAVLDCTGGWYSTQDWLGVNVGRLLDAAQPQGVASSVTFESVTGYDRRYGVDQARNYLLATQVAGGSLSHGHGVPGAPGGARAARLRLG
ncbi:MAG: molybdopterin-dependent oxidoreductase [Dehalococcoidia bacterium]|nr:molybdopterin-dependent oxidoreductase [Dehalococcoidia bacterium]